MDTRFTASQSVELAVTEQPVPIQHYLRQPQRLVYALVPATQIEILSESTFRLKMRPLKFMMLSLQPIVDLRVWVEPSGTVHLRSQSCEIRGIEYINQRFNLNLVGTLHPYDDRGKTYLTGKADLEVCVVVPPPLNLTPKSVLEATGHGVLKSVLLTVKQRLMHQLLVDYQAWAGAQASQAAQAAVNLQTSPTIN